ncbi:hypothetical protein HK101_000967, partial [Irineochytrium annulatum]
MRFSSASFYAVAGLVAAVRAAPVADQHDHSALNHRRAADSIVLTLGADVGQNGGQGINLQCNGGTLQATVNLQASINVDNIHAYQPMGEIGLPTVTALFYASGAPVNVQVLNTFNILAGTSTTNNNAWSFGLMDDGPHPGGQLSFGVPCTQGAPFPPITVNFMSSAVTNAQGLPNGADGGPPVPAVNGPVTVVNALPAQFQGTGGGAAAGALELRG